MKKLAMFVLLLTIVSIPGCGDDTPVEPDGSERWVNWHQVNSTTSAYLSDVIVADSICVAVGDRSTILTSVDGESWELQMFGLADSLKAILWADNQFLAVGNYVLSSDDASEWRVSSGEYDMRGIVQADTVLVGIGSHIYRSYNEGKDWDDVSVLRGRCYGLAWSGSRLVAAGYYIEDNGSTTAMCLSSNQIDGTGWTPHHFDTSEAFYDVIWTGSKFVLVGTEGVIKTSTYGEVWEDQESQTTEHLFGISSLNDTIVAVGMRGTIVTCVDGVEWKVRTSGVTDDLYGVYADSSRIVAVGANGTILVSE